MTADDGLPILTAAAMRAAEDDAVAAGTSIAALMELAGAGVAEWTRRLAAGAPVLVLCGPGNNGGDGYVAARVLRANGVSVRVAASGEPSSAVAITACAAWGAAVEPLDRCAPAPMVVDALFGTGLSRPLAPPLAARLAQLSGAAGLALAVDLPSGIETDTGAALAEPPARFGVTLALGALKPAHMLEPGAGRCGAVRIVDLPIDTSAATAHTLARPTLAAPDGASTKYTRGMVAVVGGAMPGAAALAAEAALRAGAGYALLLTGSAPTPMPHAVVRRDWAEDALDDKRIGAVVIGPGLGRDDRARARLDAALATPRPLVIDGDALHLLGGRTFHDRPARTVLTPHGGEFVAAFGAWPGSKLEAARAAALRSGATVVFKGADTVVAEPDGAVRVAPLASPWLSTAGTGDVLAGAVGAMLAGGNDPAVAVWLHAAAARALGPAFVADDLARALSRARATV